MALKELLTQPIGKKAEGGKGGKGGKKAKKPASAPAEKKKLTLSKGKVRRPNRRNLPVKRSINLAVSGNKKTIKTRVALPAVALIIVGAIILSKFLVVDRLLAVSRAEGEVASLQGQLNASYQTLQGFGEMTDEYAHYTYSGMTSEELNRTDRVEVLNLIQYVLLPQATVSSWSLTGNILTLDIARESLQDINLIAQRLNEDPLVDFCTVTTAATKDKRNQDVPGSVSGQIVVYLNSTPQEEAAETAETTEEVEGQ